MLKYIIVEFQHYKSCKQMSHLVFRHIVAQFRRLDPYIIQPILSISFFLFLNHCMHNNNQSIIGISKLLVSKRLLLEK